MYGRAYFLQMYFVAGLHECVINREILLEFFYIVYVQKFLSQIPSILQFSSDEPSKI